MSIYIKELEALEEKIQYIIESKKTKLLHMETFKDLDFNNSGSPKWETQHATRIALYVGSNRNEVEVVLRNDFGMYVSKTVYIDGEHEIWNIERNFGKLWNKIKPQFMKYVSKIVKWQESKPDGFQFTV